MFRRQDPTALQAQLKALTQKGGSFEADNTEWKLKRDNAGNGTAVIRFLPGKDEGLPFVKLVTHGFKMSNKWFIENCSSTHGDYDSCPVCKHMSEHDSYNTNYNLYKEIKRQTSFWTNVLIIRDPANPENEGKVFKYRFGEKIMSKIVSMAEVDPEMGEDPIDVTCVFDGANFLLKVKQEGGYANYDECKFQKQSELPRINDPEYQKELAGAMHDIMAISKPDQFKPFDELNKRFTEVMGTKIAGQAASAAANAAASLDAQLDDFDADMDDFDTNPAPKTEPKPATKAEPKPAKEEPAPWEESDIDSELDSLLADL